MRYLSYLRTLILGAGVVSAWTAVIVQSQSFLLTYGTFMHASGSTVTNPFLTPCLYGSIAFLVAFLWSCWLILNPNERSEWWLQALLVFGIVFAGVVNLYDCGEYFHIFRIGVPIVCAPGVNPLFTPCFRGFVFFLLSFVAGRYLRNRA